MKLYHKIPVALALLAIFLSFSACDDFLDEQPFSQVGEEQFWTTNGDAESGIAAMYDAMQETYRLKHYLWGEFRSDNQPTMKLSVTTSRRGTPMFCAGMTSSQ